MNRRLIGPTTITLVLCGLVGDYLFFGQSPWSVSRFLGKVFSVLSAIFTPSIDPANYGGLSHIFLPLSLIALALVLLWLSVARAKRAMTIATPNVELAPPGLRAASRQMRVEEQAQPGKIRQQTLMRRLVFAFAGVGVVFGIVVCLIVYSFLRPIIEKDVKSRADAMTLGLREKVGPQLAASRVQELAATLDQYVSGDAVAYIYVENGKGEMVAQWPAELPRYLHRDFPRSAERALSGVDTDYRDLPIYETAERVGDRSAGYVHLAIWRRVINDEARRVTTRIAAMVFTVLLGVTVLFIGVVRSLNRPFVEVVEHAARISKGDFDVPLGLQRTDEIGDLARSLERMRSSLRAVTTRLERAPLAKPLSK